MGMNHLDFLAFQLNVFSSLSPHTPLQQNLRALMAPALAKIRRHCEAVAVFHIFENAMMSEMHALVVANGETVLRTLRDEERRRSEGNHWQAPSDALPPYHSFAHEKGEVFGRQTEETLKSLSMREAALLKKIVTCGAPELGDQIPTVGDRIIVAPLPTKDFTRLGNVVIWAPSTALESKFNDPVTREGLVLFRKDMQRLLIRLFSNYYDMAPETYLPSYQCPGMKPVTLLCAQIRNFDRICQIIHHRRDLEPSEQSECIRSLVNSFTETTADISERLGGRVDQLWGSGLVAIFGEYLHTPEITPRPGCQDALEAAAEVVEALDKLADTWLESEFRIDAFKKMYADQVDIKAVIAIDHGAVMFDYIGGGRHRVFMAVGDRVNFVKQLASAAGSQTRPSNENEDEATLACPILLSQPAHEWARHVLRDRSTERVGAVHRQSMIDIPGMPWPVPIYAIWPGNVDRKARDPSAIPVTLGS